MPFKSLDDFTEVPAYEKNFKAALKTASSKPAPLLFFEGFKFASQTGALMLLGPVDAKLVQQVVAKGAKLKAKGVLLDGGERIVYKAPGVKVDVFNKALLIPKVKKRAVTADDEASGAEARDEARQEAAAAAAAAKVLKPLRARFDTLKDRSDKALPLASSNHKARVQAQHEEFETQVAKQDFKGAAKTLVVLEQLLDTIEKLHAQNKKQATEALNALSGRLTSFRTPLHEKYVKEGKDKLATAAKALADPKGLDWDRVKMLTAELEDRLDVWDALVETYADQSAEVARLKTEATQAVKKAEPKIKRAPKAAGEALKKLVTEANGVKLPTVLYEKPSFPEAISAWKRVLDWLEKNAAPDDSGPVDPLTARRKKFVHNKPSTWEVNGVRYLNGTSASDIGGKAALLADASLSSNTTAGGSVLKVNYEGHCHLDGGSGGMAFVYRLEDDYTVTPLVVDTSSKRGGRNGNQYMWDTGGSWAYFPPNAKY